MLSESLKGVVLDNFLGERPPDPSPPHLHRSIIFLNPPLVKGARSALIPGHSFIVVASLFPPACASWFQEMHINMLFQYRRETTCFLLNIVPLEAFIYLI